MKVSVSVSAPGLCPGLMLVRHKYTPPAVPLASPSHSEGNYPTGFAGPPLHTVKETTPPRHRTAVPRSPPSHSEGE